MREVLVEIPKTEPRKELKEQIALQVNEEWKTLSYIGRKFVALAKRIRFNEDLRFDAFSLKLRRSWFFYFPFIFFIFLFLHFHGE